MQNLHPIFIHFPIALFTIYTLLEIFPYRKFQNSLVAFPIKAIFIMFGSLSSLLTLETGSLAEDAIGRTSALHQLVNVHSTFAATTCYVYGFLALLYLITLIERYISADKIPASLQKIWNVILKIKGYFWRRYFLISLALIGLILVTITGALGGAIVYGPDTDPIVKFIYPFFIK